MTARGPFSSRAVPAALLAAGTALILPYARAYAEHLGLEMSDEELGRALEHRLSLTPPLGRVLCTLGALLSRWVFPVLFARSLPPFDAMTPEGRELMLSRLQSYPSALLRGLFVSLRSVLLPVFYGGPRQLSKIGYAGGAGA